MNEQKRHMIDVLAKLVKRAAKSCKSGCWPSGWVVEEIVNRCQQLGLEPPLRYNLFRPGGESLLGRDYGADFAEFLPEEAKVLAVCEWRAQFQGRLACGIRKAFAEGVINGRPAGMKLIETPPTVELGEILRDFVAYLRCQAKEPPTVKREERGRPQSGRKVKARVNARVLELVQLEPETIHLSAAAIARKLGCSKSAVIASKSWRKVILKRRADERAERAARLKRPI